MSAPLLRRAGQAARAGLRAPPSTIPRHGFLHPVDLERRPARARRVRRDARRPRVRGPRPRRRARRRPDLVYTFDPLLVTDRGAIPLRPGKPNRAPASPTPSRPGRAPPASRPSGRIEAPGTIEGGDTFWLRPDLFCIGRTLRTNDAGRPAARRARRRRRPDLRRPVLARARPSSSTSCRSSRRSPTTSPSSTCRCCRSGCGSCSRELGIRLVEVPEEEFPTLGCNVLAVRPGVVILAEGNPRTAAALAAAGCEVHAYPPTEVGDQRLGRADLHDPADPAWLTPRRGGRDGGGRGRRERSSPTSRRSSGSRASPGPRRPSRPGPPTALRELGLAVEVVRPGPGRRSAPTRPGRARRCRGRRCRSSSAGPAAPGGRRLILSGHLDVVPPGDPATWTADPWGGEIRDGALYGRGACDMKGGVAAILAAVRALGARGRPRPARRRAGRRARAVRGGRRAGHAGRDPGRRRPATWRSSPSRRTSTSSSPTPARSRSG